MALSITKVPYDMAIGAEISYAWDVVTNVSEGGINTRTSKRATPIRNFTLTIGPDDALELRSVYLALAGPRWPVGVRDWSDYTLTDETLTLDSTDATYSYYPLVKAFAPATGNRTYSQRVLLPDETEVSISIKVNDVAPSAADWSLQDYGIVRIKNSILSGYDTVTASGQFIYPCCFVDNELPFVIHDRFAPFLSAQDVQLREILEAEFRDLTA